MTFGPDAYAQGDRFQLEKRRLFAEAWLPLCASGQIAAPGAFVSQSIGGWPLMAVRGADGVARGFRNTCRHQGMPVIEKPAGTCETGGIVQVRGRAREAVPAPRFDLEVEAFTGATTTDIDANWKAVVECLLADSSWRFVWPLAAVGAGVVRQIVPRSFLRTRLIDLSFGGTAASIKADAEALQARRVAGDATSDAPAVAAFRSQLAAVCSL
jgi:hypothetical protein